MAPVAYGGVALSILRVWLWPLSPLTTDMVAPAGRVTFIGSR